MCCANWEIDVLATTENNVAWHHIPATQWLLERISGWWEACYLTTAHNTRDPNATPYQPGGMAILSINRSAHRVSSCGQDPGGLGRFCWTTYRGHNNCTLHIVAGYHPSTSHNGHLLVTQQHWQVFSKQTENNIHPRTQFWNDLWPLLANWIEMGNQILVAMDVNENIQLPTIGNFFWSFRLSEAIAQRHGPTLPPTHNQGSTPIDAIFVTPGLLGHIWQPTHNKKYLNYLQKHCKNSNLFQKIKDMANKIKRPEDITPAIQYKINKLDNLCIQGMMWAEC